MVGGAGCGSRGAARASVPEEQVYYGTVKGFDDAKGWGHITCGATRAMYGKDMFVLRSSLRGARIRVGEEV
eukprot:7619711-Alexandrium_andersonii.AAC.1